MHQTAGCPGVRIKQVAGISFLYFLLSFLSGDYHSSSISALPISLMICSVISCRGRLG